MHKLTIASNFLKSPPTTLITRSFQSSPRVYTKLIETYARDQSLFQGKVLHAHLILNGWARLTHFTYKLMALYVETKQLSDARKLFDRIPESNSRRWIELIGVYSRCGLYKEALNGFVKMIELGFRPNEFVIPSVLKACGHVVDIRTGKTLHGVVLKHSVETDTFVISALIDMYCKCREIEKARWIFDGMEEKDLVAMNAMVSGYARTGLAGKGLVLVEKVQMLGLKPDIVTWNILIAGFAKNADEVMATKLFELMSVNDVKADVVSWTSIISGMVQNFRHETAFNTFKRMLRNGLIPTSATLSSLLPACATMSNVRLGKQIHGYAVMNRAEEDLYVRSALVDMYAKCGFISEARMLFCKMTERNTVTWNSMIFAFANHGYCDEAIELFNQMEKAEESKLDHLTFTAVLTACGHAGLVELGESLFLMMREKYKIAPRLEHYACVVDLLGKAGKLSEAYNMIKMMPLEPDLFVWGALLGACRSHGDIGLAEIAARQLAELEPKNAGNKMLMSQLYAGAGSWENVARFKNMFKTKKLKSFPGCSWVETC
ncbi:hypothetical protein K2173_001838 [Erythroxylum novogranatense]|uniref:Pentatricopeptide repeat-containing protein n=1 Tax=Erythroxylum novogranatense TaxID=1862640 RepID=A0AAV8TTZ5_9ROSI|nr:hypothetical protein K2173_001838 [Erythroxylum novogranatense]